MDLEVTRKLKKRTTWSIMLINIVTKFNLFKIKWVFKFIKNKEKVYHDVQRCSCKTILFFLLSKQKIVFTFYIFSLFNFFHFFIFHFFIIWITCERMRVVVKTALCLQATLTLHFRCWVLNEDHLQFLPFYDTAVVLSTTPQLAFFFSLKICISTTKHCLIFLFSMLISNLCFALNSKLMYSILKINLLFSC